MGWVKLDDRYATHPRLVAAGLEARGLDVAALCYASGQETDGFVAEAMLPVVAAGARSPGKLAARLVEVGRWHRADGKAAPTCPCLATAEVDPAQRGWWIHDFLAFNPSRAEMEAKRAEERKRKASGRKAQGRDHSGRITSGRIPPGIQAEAARNPSGSRPESSGTPPGIRPVSHRSRPVPSPYPSQTLPAASTNGAAPDVGNGAVPAPEMEISKPKPHDAALPASPAVRERWEGMWPRRRREALEVLARLLEHFDEHLVDEAIGHCVARDTPPASPRYLVSLVLDWSRQRGVYPDGHAVYAQLGGSPASGA